MNHLSSLGVIIGIGGNHDVPTAGECAFWQGFPRLATHYDGVAHSQGFESAQVFADMKSEVATTTYGTVAPGGHNYLYAAHTLTSALMCGCGS